MNERRFIAYSMLLDRLAAPYSRELDESDVEMMVAAAVQTYDALTSAVARSEFFDNFKRCAELAASERDIRRYVR